MTCEEEPVAVPEAAGTAIISSVTERERLLNLLDNDEEEAATIPGVDKELIKYPNVVQIKKWKENCCEFPCLSTSAHVGCLRAKLLQKEFSVRWVTYFHKEDNFVGATFSSRKLH